MNNGDVLTVDEAAAYAHRHPVTLYVDLKAGDLHGSQRVRGGRWTILRGCVDDYMAGRVCAHLSNVIPLRRTA